MTMMPGGEPIPPSLRKELDELWRAVRALSAPTHKSEAEEYIEKEITFSHPEVPNADVEAPPYHVRFEDGYITELRMAYASVLSYTGSTRLQILINGVVEHDTVWTASLLDDYDSYVEDDLMIPVEQHDLVSVVIKEANGLQFTAQIIFSIPKGGE